MPFVTIELPEKLNFALHPFAKEVHAYLSEFLDIPIEKLKTKLVRLPEVFVGSNADPEDTYAHIKVELMQGRDKVKLVAAVNQLLFFLKDALEKQNPSLQCRVTAEFREMDPELLVATLIGM